MKENNITEDLLEHTNLGDIDLENIDLEKVSSKIDEEDIDFDIDEEDFNFDIDLDF